MRSDITRDVLFGGILELYQPASGYRFSIDSLLLANFVHLNDGDEVIELGSGCGVISIILAKRYSSVKLIGVEIQEELHELAVENAKMNGVEDRVEFKQKDVRNIEDIFTENSLDVCVSNPPYRKKGSGRIPPNTGRAVARHELELILKELIGSAGYLLKEDGHMFLIQNAERFEELKSILEECDFSLCRMRFVHPFDGKVSDFVLIDAVFKIPAIPEILKPLVIWRSMGEYTDEVERIVKGEWIL